MVDVVLVSPALETAVELVSPCVHPPPPPAVTLSDAIENQCELRR